MTFRRSGSVSRYFVTPRPDTAPGDLTPNLKKRRFRSIEDDTEEVESVGWVTGADPSGASPFEGAFQDDLAFLQMRADKKTVPPAWLRLKVGELERAARAAGEKINKAQRQSWREQVTPELLERVLPSVNLVDVVWRLARGQVYLFGTSSRAHDNLAALWVRSFEDEGGPPEAVTPSSLLARWGLPQAALDRWRDLRPLALLQGAEEETSLTVDEFVGEEFLTWLWWRCEVGGGKFTLPGEVEVSIVVEDDLVLRDSEAVDKLKGGSPSRSAEASAALGGGKRLARAKLTAALGDRQWSFQLDAAVWQLCNVSVPAPDPEESESLDVQAFDGFVDLANIVDQLLGLYVRLRLAPAFENDTLPAMRDWVTQRQAK